jgi:[protein-PII] uridylyltransferase
MPLRLSPARIEHVVDGMRLRAQLTAAALDNIGSDEAARKRALDLLHGALFRGRMIAKERLEMGADGHETARLLAKVADEVITALFDFVTVHVFRSRNPTEGERFALVAVGGYGRQQLAPSSDIDLLFLRSYKETPWSESVTEFMLYMLWDMALKVGHASRTIPECLKLAREDHTVQTALLEARFLGGDKALFAEFEQRFRRDVVTVDHRNFVAAKLKERDQRHVRAGATRYLVEPNVKEGKGGLRDLHTIFWTLRHRYGWAEPHRYIETGVFTVEELATYLRASNFFWRVRCHLHFLTGRAEERLTFDVQPELASRMGYGDRGGKPAVERFMKRYFLAAKDVGALSRALTSRIETEDEHRGAFGFHRKKSARKAINTPGYCIEGGRLAAASPTLFDDDPVELVRAFQVADKNGLDMHSGMLSDITRRLKRINGPLRANAAAKAAFLEVAASQNDPGGALRMMNEAGVLGRFLPEFGRIVAQMQFNMYHHYTVDEHTLRAVEIISEIEDGRCKAEHPLATTIFPKIVNRRALYLAMLLHDTGKGVGDQQIDGAKTAAAACRRLGLPEEEVELVAWLVRHHLMMSDVAQKRDIGDPRTVATFAERVGSLERLRLLLVLTVADIRAVGPGVWNGWKGQLLRDLYRLTEAGFHGGRTDEASVRERLSLQAQEKRLALIDAVKPSPALSTWLSTMDDAYWLSFDDDSLVWHAQAAGEALKSGEDIYVAVRAMPHATDILVHAPDRPGLFAARGHTTSDGKAFDVFSILDIEGKPYGAGDEDLLNRVASRVRAAARGENVFQTAKHHAPRRAAAFAIEPWARIDNDTSPAFTVIEVSGRDRPGLLAGIAKVFADEGVHIGSAHIDSYGERVEDVFYVTCSLGKQIVDPDRVELLQDLLLKALREGEPGAPSDPAKQPLAVAPASRAR